MKQVLASPVKKELALKLPQTFEDILLLCPGVWNGLEYNSLEINNAFLNTDWNDKSNTHLYLDHQDTQERGVANWAGFVKNPRMIDGELRGDLEVWDEPTARFLREAEAKFGVSATLEGLHDESDDSVRSFHFNSFSIVTNPGCKPAWINLSQDEGLRKIRAISKMYGIKILQDDLSKNSTSLGGNQLNIGKKMEKKNLEEEQATGNTENVDESKSEESSEEVVSDSGEESNEAKESEESSSEELSSNDLLKELSSKFDKLTSLLEKSLAHTGDYGQGEGGPVKKAKDPKKPRLLDSGMEEIKKQLSQINEKLVERDKDVTAKRMTLAISDSLVPDRATDADQGMLHFLQRRI